MTETRLELVLKSLLFVCAGALALCSNAFAAETPTVRAFPGAEGYGAVTPGGRGGRVIAVTNLNDSGPGSLQAACEAEGPRIVVFKVAGTIDGNVDIKNDFITIAGQTAPGDGITIKGHLGIGADDVIIRYIRVRHDGEGAAGDAVGSRGHRNLILDHVSASWSTDEVMSIYSCENVTIQWCMIAEAGSETHKFGGIWGSNYGTHHHNLFAHNISRNPRFGSATGLNDFRNNVIYNWKYQSVYGGEKNWGGQGTFSCNVVANYYKPGPGTDEGRRSRILDPSTRDGEADAGKWWVADNYVAGFPEVTADNWKGVTKQEEYFRLNEPWSSMPISQQSAEEAYVAVLERVGCSLPVRDAIDARIIEDVRNGTATKGENGFVLNPEEAGGWIEMKSGPVPADSDNDGMPDEWESRNGLDASDASDAAKDEDGDGYTNVEEFLNGTDPTVFVDYTKPENNVNTLE